MTSLAMRRTVTGTSLLPGSLVAGRPVSSRGDASVADIDVRCLRHVGHHAATMGVSDLPAAKSIRSRYLRRLPAQLQCAVAGLTRADSRPRHPVRGWPARA